MADAPRVFISYSDDSPEHADRVLALADALCDDGIDVILDQYVHPAPENGWPRWMEENLDTAKFVVMICTEIYLRRVMSKEKPGQGTGVRWEGNLIYNRICYDNPAGSRYIPILFPGSSAEHIPGPVRGHNHYVLFHFNLDDPRYEALYRHLTNQPPTPKRKVGSLKKLPPRPRPRLSASGSPEVREQTSRGEQGQAETLSELKKELQKLACEQIRDDEDDVVQPLLKHLHKTLRCDFDPEPAGIVQQLAAFLIEYRPYTLTALDQIYSQICDQGLRKPASVIHHLFRLTFPFQLPHNLWSFIEEQQQAGRSVLANAAPGVVFAEAVAARIHGKPAVVTVDGDGVKVPMRLGPFPFDDPPVGNPEGTLESVVREILRGARIDSGGMTVAEMLSLACGFFEKWQEHHGRPPYIVVKLPRNADDRANYERVLTQIKEAVKHVHFLGYYTDPTALGVEGGLQFLLRTHYDSVRKWKNP